MLFTSQRATFTDPLRAALHRAGRRAASRSRCRSRTRRAPPTRPTASASPTTRSPRAFLQWKHYRGGTASQIWLYNAKGHAVEKIPQPATRANDTDPMWIGDTVYFRSDRNGEFNLFAYDTKIEAGPAAHAARRLPGPQRLGRRRPDRLRAGRLPAPARSATADSAEADDRRRRRTCARRGRASSRAREWIRDAALSPTGARAAFEFRGEIVTVPGEKGDVRNLTNSAGVHDRFPAWSPDGQSIAWFSDAARRVPALHRQPGRQGRAARDQGRRRRLLQRRRSGRRTRRRSPTSTTRRASTGSTWRAASRRRSRRSRSTARSSIISYAWSPDSKWLAYAHGQPRRTSRPSTLYSLEQDKSFQVTDGLSDVSEPVFDASGKYLYFLASTDAGRCKDWFAQSNADMRATSAHLPRRAAERRAVAARAGERRREAGARREEGRGEAGRRRSRSAGGADAGGQAGRPRRISRSASTSTACEYRILDLPIAAGDLSNLQAGTAGQVYYLKTVDGKSALQPLRPRRRARTRRCCPTSPTTSSRPTARSCSIASGNELVDRADDEEDRAGAKDGSPSTPSRCASIRAPSGSRSSTRRGGSTATTSTTRTCTASTGRRCARSTRRSCRTSRRART